MSARRRLSCTVACAAAGLAVLFLTGAKKGPLTRLSLDPDAEVVPLFDGIERGVFKVRVVPKSEFSAQVFVSNETQQPKTVQLPKAAVGVHVLKQFDFPLPVDDIGDDDGNDGPGQSTLGTFSPIGQQNSTIGNPFNFQQGFFSIPPETAVRIGFHSVCLEHGKPDPQPKMTYVLRPLEDEVDDPVLRKLIESYDPRETDRGALQAAVWHLAGEGLSWRQLAAKRVTHIGRRPRRYFRRKYLEDAQELVAEAEKSVEREASRKTAAASNERR